MGSKVCCTLRTPDCNLIYSLSHVFYVEAVILLFYGCRLLILQRFFSGYPNESSHSLVGGSCTLSRPNSVTKQLHPTPRQIPSIFDMPDYVTTRTDCGIAVVLGTKFRAYCADATATRHFVQLGPSRVSVWSVQRILALMQSRLLNQDVTLELEILGSY